MSTLGRIGPPPRVGLALILLLVLGWVTLLLLFVTSGWVVLALLLFSALGWVAHTLRHHRVGLGHIRPPSPARHVRIIAVEAVCGCYGSSLLLLR